MANGLGYTANSVVTAVTNAPTVLLQGTTSAAVTVDLHRIEASSSLTGSTQAVAEVDLGTYVAGTAGGTTVTPVATNPRNTVAAATAFKAITATMGTTFTMIRAWLWNMATPFDMVLGKDITVQKFQVSKAFAFILPSAAGTPNVAVSFSFEED